MSCLIFKHEVLDIYILFVLWWVAIFLLNFISFLLLRNDWFSYLNSNPIASLWFSYLSESAYRFYIDNRQFDPYLISSSLSFSICYSQYTFISSSISSFLSNSFDIFPLILHFNSYPADSNNNQYEFNVITHYHDSSAPLSSFSTTMTNLNL